MSNAPGPSQMSNSWFTVRKKPVEVEANGPLEDPEIVSTLEGDFEIDQSYIDAHGGYYLIRGVEGEIYPCRKDIFEDTYEVVDPVVEDLEARLSMVESQIFAFEEPPEPDDKSWLLFVRLWRERQHLVEELEYPQSVE